MADVFVRNRRSQTRRRGRELGEIPLSSGEIEYLTRVDEAARRRQRLLQVREQEKRAAQLVTQRYRENLKKLQGYRMKYAQQDHLHDQEVLLSALHEKYQLSLQGMGTAQRQAREKVMELVKLAQIEQRKWADNRRGEKERFDDAIDAVHDDTAVRLARRREVERNLLRLKKMSMRQRNAANDRAKRELEMQLQLQRAQEEAERYRLEHAETEEFSYPRKTQRDVTAYQFTRTHCVTLPSHSGKENNNGSAGGPAGNTEVKVIRHNRVLRNATSAIDQAEAYRRVMERKQEDQWRLREENARVAGSRGQDAIHVVEAVRGGERAIEWLASMDRHERTDTAQQLETEYSNVKVQPHQRGERLFDGEGSEAFARMFGIEDTGDLVGMSGTDDEHIEGPQRVAVRRGDSFDESDFSSIFSGQGHKMTDADRDERLIPRSAAERAIEQKLDTMEDLLKRVATYGHVKPKTVDDGDGERTENDEMRRRRYEVWKRTEAQQLDSPVHSFASHSSGEENGAIQPKPTSGTVRQTSERDVGEETPSRLPVKRSDLESLSVPGISVYEVPTTHDHHLVPDGETVNNIADTETNTHEATSARGPVVPTSQIDAEQTTTRYESSETANGNRERAIQEGEVMDEYRLSLEQLEMQLNERTRQLASRFGRRGSRQAGPVNYKHQHSNERDRRSIQQGDRDWDSTVLDEFSEVGPRQDGVLKSRRMRQNEEDVSSLINESHDRRRVSHALDRPLPRDTLASVGPRRARAAVERHMSTPPLTSSSRRSSSKLHPSLPGSDRFENSVSADSKNAEDRPREESVEYRGFPTSPTLPEHAENTTPVKALHRHSDRETAVGMTPRDGTNGPSESHLENWKIGSHASEEDQGSSTVSQHAKTGVPARVAHHSSHMETIVDVSPLDGANDQLVIRRDSSETGSRASHEHDAHQTANGGHNVPGASFIYEQGSDIGQHLSSPHHSTGMNGEDTIDPPSRDASASKEIYGDDFKTSDDGDGLRIVASDNTHTPNLDNDSLSGSVMRTSSVQAHNSPVHELMSDEDHDRDITRFPSHKTLHPDRLSYLRRMSEDQQSMSESLLSLPQYSLPRSDSFSSMNDSHLGLDSTGSIANQLVPIFPSLPNTNKNDSEASGGEENRPSGAAAKDETSILIEGLSPQETRAELLQPQQLPSEGSTQDAKVEVGERVQTPGNMKGEEVTTRDQGILPGLDDDTEGRGRSVELKTQAMPRMLDQSYSSDSSSDMSAFMYLERMRKMTGFVNISNKTPNIGIQPHGNPRSDSSRVNAAETLMAHNETRTRSQRRSEFRRDSVSSSSSSTPSVDARFQYLVNMTAVAGRALPLHLNLSADYSTRANTRLAHPRMDLMLYSSESESDTSKAKIQTRHGQDGGKGGPKRHQSTEDASDAGSSNGESHTVPTHFGVVDLSIPPSPMFRSSSSVSSDIRSASFGDKSGVSAGSNANQSLPQFDLKDLGHRLASLPPPPFGNLDMSQPPAPLTWITSDGESDSDNSEAVYGPDLPSRCDTETTAHREATAVGPHRKGEALYVPLEDTEQRKMPQAQSPDGVSLADAFHARHPSFLQRTQSTKALLAQRRNQLEQRRASEYGDGLAQSRDSVNVQPATTSRATPQPSALSMPKPDLLDRLASGQRAKISAEEMRERTRRLYSQLPEVTERKRQEDVLERRRQRLTELREREKARRQQQRERQNRAS